MARSCGGAAPVLQAPDDEQGLVGRVQRGDREALNELAPLCATAVRHRLPNPPATAGRGRSRAGRAILRHEFNAVNDIREDTWLKMQAIMDDTRRKLDSVLSATQRERYHAMLAEQDQRFRPCDAARLRFPFTDGKHSMRTILAPLA